MTKRRRTLLTVLVLLAAGATQALASGRDVINDCTDDEVLSKSYTQKEYRDALANLPADADQYGNCREVIARAQEQAASEPSAPEVVPSAVGSANGTDAGTSLSDLPPPILALLAFGVVGALGLGAVAIRRLVNARGA